MAISIEEPGPRIGLQDIVRIEAELKSSLPEDYKEFLLANNGGSPETNNLKIPSLQTSLGVRDFYGIRGEGVDLDILHEQRFFKARLPAKIIAIANDSCGNLVCLSLRKLDFGHIFFWDHEMEVKSDSNRALTKLSESFSAFLASLSPFDPQQIQLPPGIKMTVHDPEFFKRLKEDNENK